MFFFFLMIRRPPRSTLDRSSAASDVYKRQTGCYPHLIISNLKRTKLDPNRNLEDGACGNVEAETAWNEFHDFIEDARNAANLQYDDKTLSLIHISEPTRPY